MQIFDTLLIVTLFVFIGFGYTADSKRPLWLVYFPIVALVLAFIQIFIEGYRWQMVPAYIVVLLSQIYLFRRLKKDKQKNNVQKVNSRWANVRRIFATSSAILVLLSSVLFSYFLPIFDLPKPTGTYAVGSSELHLIDETRLETYTSNPTDKRELVVRVWYPAGADFRGDKNPMPYWPHASILSAALGRMSSLPSFLLSHLDNVSAHSYWQVPVSKLQSDYPVLIFSHGFGQYATQNIHLMESLASHGYIIFAIDHAYAGMGSIFPDGRVALFNKKAFAALGGQPTPELMALFDEVSSTSYWKKQVELMVKAESMMGGPEIINEALAIWEADQRFVLTELEKLHLGVKSKANNLNPNSFIFQGRLGLSRLGLFGMSFGGSTSLGNCIKDNRCKAGINMDGFMLSQTALPALQRPFMFMNSETNHMYNAMFEIAEDDVYSVSIDGATHGNYSDFSIISPLFEIVGVTGSIDGYQMLTITEDYVRAFFDKHLKGRGTSLLDQTTNKYAEVTFRTKSKSSSD